MAPLTYKSILITNILVLQVWHRQGEAAAASNCSRPCTNSYIYLETVTVPDVSRACVISQPIT